MAKQKALILFLFLGTLTSYTQDSYFNRIEILTDTSSYNSIEHQLEINGINRLGFVYTNPRQVVEVRLYPKSREYRFDISSTRDYMLIDSLLFINNYYRFKIEFTNLNRSELLRFTIGVESDSIISFEEVLLQPFTKTNASLNVLDNELYIGEEKAFEVYSDNIENLNISGEWTNTSNFDYRLTKEGGRVFINLIPKQTGNQLLEAAINAIKPSLDEDGKLQYAMSPLVAMFKVTESRLQFLSLDQTEVTLSDQTKLEGYEVQLSNSRLLAMNKTYRIEAQEEPGGALMAEIHTKRRLGNNRVLCVIRPYNYHRSIDGYLYIKDGDVPKFITNFSITPATNIEKVFILKDGNQWQPANTVKPGETVNVKLEGEGMHKAKFYFEDLILINRDSLVITENQQVFKLKVPIDISKQTINIFNHGYPTGKSLKVQEYQRPREFDFMFINYGERARRVSQIKEPILYEGIVKDMIISFNNNTIDDQELYGKQYIDLEVRITGKRDELIELKRIENITVCPSGRSPRADNYNAFDCFNGDISLNKYIRKETSDLEGWSRINLQIAHKQDKYSEKVYEKEVEVILKRRTSFDIELSFPAGLITISKQDNDSIGFGSLSGISLAMIGQFSFYHPEKINRYRPYKIGAGFLALNAFNFSDDAQNRDVGLVILGSLYPTTRDTKLTFPLYIGGGYFIKDQKFFFLIGPGIRLRL